jgi:DinB superfamily
MGFSRRTHLRAEDRSRILRWLEESHEECCAAIEGVSDAQWTWKPAPDRWSVGETAEHIVLAEAVLFSFVQKAIASPPNASWEAQTTGKTELLERAMRDRSGKATAPEPIVPRQGLTRDQVGQRFAKQRAAIETFARETTLALQEHTADHPFPVFGTLNASQWLVLLPLHTMRHLTQIAEVRATPGYPAA